MVSDKAGGGDFSAEDEAALRQLALIASLALQHIQAAAEVLERVDELERFNTASVGRELRIIQIKKEVNVLCAELGRPPQYVQGLEEDL